MEAEVRQYISHRTSYERICEISSDLHRNTNGSCGNMEERRDRIDREGHLQESSYGPQQHRPRTSYKSDEAEARNMANNR